MKLYEISQEYQMALSELTDMTDIAVIDTLDALKGELQKKQISVAAYIGNIEAEAKAIKEAELRMSARRKALENRSASIRNYLKMNMVAHGIHEIITPEFVVKVKNNPPAVEVYAEDKLPKEFISEKVITSIDKASLKSALKSGDVLGARLTQGTRLDIK